MGNKTIFYTNMTNKKNHFFLGFSSAGVARYLNTKIQFLINILTRCTRGVRVFFSVTRMRSSNSARMNKFDFTTEKIGSVHMTVFEIVALRNVDNWIQLLT